MSSPSRRLTISATARRDIRDILSFTERTWGADKSREYRDLLDTAMQGLIVHPHVGRRRDEHADGCRSLVVESHVIFYRVEQDQVKVGRVLHSNQDAAGKVEF